MSLEVVLGALALVALVVGIILEGRRQARRLGKPASGRPGALGSAMLEAQKLLEPERSVELLQDELRGAERPKVEHEQRAGDEPPEDDEPPP